MATSKWSLTLVPPHFLTLFLLTCLLFIELSRIYIYICHVNGGKGFDMTDRGLILFKSQKCDIWTDGLYMHCICQKTHIQMFSLRFNNNKFLLKTFGTCGSSMQHVRAGKQHKHTTNNLIQRLTLHMKSTKTNLEGCMLDVFQSSKSVCFVKIILLQH